jgi:hypothetical protein
MLFESSKPVSGSSFFNRTKELYELIESTKGLKQGSTKYLALLGNRKTGIDEFQELAELNHFNAIKEILGDIFLFLRSHWQKHLRINYIISGSKLSLMKQILTHENAPFFKIQNISSGSNNA